MKERADVREEVVTRILSVDAVMNIGIVRSA